MIRIGALAVLLAAPSAPVAGSSLHVKVHGIERFEGNMKVALCRDSLDETGCRVGLTRPARTPVETFTFTDLDPGRYAVICYQDLNGNDQLDYGVFGLPAEPYGLSNDVGRLRPPSFEAAAIEVGAAGATVGLRIGGLFD